MGNYKKLASNSLIFLIANFGSKILTFVMVPYYTYCLTISEYGTVDLLVSTISLVSPLISFGMGDIMTLYLVQKRHSPEKIFTNSIILLFGGNIVIYIIFPIIYSIETFKSYIWFFFSILLIQSVYGILQCFARGIDKVKNFAVSGVLYTFILVSLNVIFLSKFKLGINGYLLSMLLAYTISAIYLFVKVKAYKLFKIKEFDKKYYREILKLSLPLLPTSIMWWMMTISDKYIILFFLTASANGLYTVAHKIPTILSTIYNVFQSAWQLTTMEMKSKEERVEMYSKLFEILSGVLFIGSICLIIVCKPLIQFFCEESYSEAWVCVPMLLFSSLYNSLSGFIGSNYLIMGNTFKTLKVTCIGTIINLVLNTILVPVAGIQGAAVATCMGFMFMTFKKIYDIREFTPLNINWKRFIISNFVVIIQTVVILNCHNSISYIVGGIILLFVIFMYKDIGASVIGKFVKATKNKFLR